MPYGLHRYQQAESLHFKPFSCFHRLPYLSSPESKSLVEAILEQTRAVLSERAHLDRKKTVVPFLRT